MVLITIVTLGLARGVSCLHWGLQGHLQLNILWIGKSLSILLCSKFRSFRRWLLHSGLYDGLLLDVRWFRRDSAHLGFKLLLRRGHLMFASIPLHDSSWHILESLRHILGRRFLILFDNSYLVNFFNHTILIRNCCLANSYLWLGQALHREVDDRATNLNCFIIAR